MKILQKNKQNQRWNCSIAYDSRLPEILLTDTTGWNIMIITLGFHHRDICGIYRLIWKEKVGKEKTKCTSSMQKEFYRPETA